MTTAPRHHIAVITACTLTGTAWNGWAAYHNDPVSADRPAAGNPSSSVLSAELGTTIARVSNPKLTSNNPRVYDIPGSSPGIVVKTINEWSSAATIVVAPSTTRKATCDSAPRRHSIHWTK